MLNNLSNNLLKELNYGEKKLCKAVSNGRVVYAK